MDWGGGKMGFCLASMVPWETGLPPGRDALASATALFLAETLMETDLAVKSLRVHENDFHGEAG